MPSIWSYLLCVHLLATLVQGGVVQIAGPEEEAYALRMWRDMCQNGRQESATDGGNNVYCAQDENEAAGLRSTVEIAYPTIKLANQRNEPANQIIVIDPPSQHFNHKINIEGDSVPAPKTTIYVRPRADVHQLEVIRQRDGNSNSPPPKPTILFLGQNGNVDSEASVFGGNGGGARILSPTSPSTDAIHFQGQGSEVVEQRRKIKQDVDDEDKENLIGASFPRGIENTRTVTGSDRDISSSGPEFSSSRDQGQAGTTGTTTTTRITTTSPSVATTPIDRGQSEVTRSTGNQEEGISADQSQISETSRINNVGETKSRQNGDEGVRNSGLVGESSFSVVRVGGVAVPSASNDANGGGVLIGGGSSQSRQGFGDETYVFGVGNAESGLGNGNERQVSGNTEQGTATTGVTESISVDTEGSRIGSSSTPNIYFNFGGEATPAIGESNTQSGSGVSTAAGSGIPGETYSLRYGDIRYPTGTGSFYQIGGGIAQSIETVREGADPSSYQSTGSIGVGSPSIDGVTSFLQTEGGSATGRLSSSVQGSVFTNTGSDPTTTTTTGEYVSSRYAPGFFDYSQYQGIQPENFATASFQTPSSSSSSQERRTFSSSSSSPNYNRANENDSSFPYSVDLSQNSGTGGVGLVELTVSSKSINVNLGGQQDRRSENGQTRRQRRKKQRGQGRQGQQNVDPNGDATSSVFFEMDHSEMMHYSVRHPY